MVIETIPIEMKAWGLVSLVNNVPYPHSRGI